MKACARGPENGARPNEQKALAGFAATDGRPVRILVVTPFADDGWTWLAKYFRDRPIEWTFLRGALFGKRDPCWWLYVIRVARKFKAYDLIISHAPYMSLYVALAMWLTRTRKPHWAYSFNHGNQRFFTGPRLALARRVFAGTELFVVYSDYERRLLGRMYGIHEGKMSFHHWAVNPPEVAELSAELQEFAPYASCVGRNNRDFETWLTDIKGLALNGVLVCPKDAVDPGLVPPNVRVKTDISFEDCMKVLAQSYVNVVPLKDATTGAGHMTIVSAMQLGKPQIVTDIEAVRDYFFDGVHGRVVQPGDFDGLRRVMAWMIENPAACAAFGKNAQSFADRWLVERSAAESLAGFLDCFVEGAPYPLEPHGWSEYKESHV